MKSKLIPRHLPGGKTNVTWLNYLRAIELGQIPKTVSKEEEFYDNLDNTMFRWMPNNGDGYIMLNKLEPRFPKTVDIITKVIDNSNELERKIDNKVLDVIKSMNKRINGDYVRARLLKKRLEAGKWTNSISGMQNIITSNINNLIKSNNLLKK